LKVFYKKHVFFVISADRFKNFCLAFCGGNLK
jgi:hypothetical protein